MIKLYHGSNVEITKIDLSMCKNGKDFGKGYYLNANFEQARAMAKKAVRITHVGHEVINGFEFDDNVLFDKDIKVKIFGTEKSINLLKRI